MARKGVLSALFLAACGAAVATNVVTAAASRSDGSGVLFAFTGGSKHVDPRIWQGYNWDAITHLAFWSDPVQGVLDLAKNHSVKLVQVKSMLKPAEWVDPNKRAVWIAQSVGEIAAAGYHGLSFDFEGNGLSAEQQTAYVAYAKETKEALVAKVGSEAYLGICVGGRPAYEWRNYNYTGLTLYADHLFIMAYDMISYDDYTCITIGTCSYAEAGYPDISAGVSEYLKAGVSGDRMILGLPWYGARYTSVLGVDVFVGQIDYSNITQILAAHPEYKPQYDDKQKSWHVTCNGACDGSNGKKGGVMWWDDAVSLAPKYKLAKDNGLAGVGTFEASKLPYITAPDKAKAMWDAIAAWDS
mmetsp:Transcript_155350/g.377405  ORF Transcript_155350/g.377405 Transcript_155350/m.377405 type:complete len:356 (+) Transcript_155350:180-1247(+)